METQNSYGISSLAVSCKNTTSASTLKFITRIIFSVSTILLLILMTLHTDYVSGLGTCNAGELRCHSGNCVPKEKVCDGVRDCTQDGLDENDLICSPKYRRSLCGSRQKKGVFQCEYGGCVPLSRVCDGAINCLDGSDESEHVCGANSCLPGQFRCKYGACIPDYRVCNGQIHCPDGSDETIDVCKKRTCKDDQFMCKYGGCVPERKICDGWKNCADGSDETPELCLITRAKMQQVWEKAELIDGENSDTYYHPVNTVLSLTRRPTQPTTTTKRPLEITTSTSTTSKPVPRQIIPSIETDPVFSSIANIIPVESKIQTCALPNIPPNSEATITSCRSNPSASYCTSNSTTVPYGVKVDFLCTPGYVINGPEVISCKETGQWSSSPPTCEAIIDVRFGLSKIITTDFRVRCPPLTAARGVQLECIDPKNLEVKSCAEAQKSGVEARFTCAPYYSPSGDLPMHYEKCGTDGNWSPGVQTLFSCKPDCGLAEVTKTPYILNGVSTQRGVWPWHVGIYIQTEDKLKYICGGSLITENSVLTSAHCVTIGGNLRNVSSLVLFLGKQKIDLPDNDPFVQRRLVSQIFVEDSYNYLILDSDIAILALSTPAILTYYVRPSCYPQNSNSFLEEYQLTPGSLGTVLGWGYNENGTLSPSLRMTQLPVVSAAECAESHRDFFASQTRSTTYCAGYLNGTAVCNGDSGGGMYFRAVTRGSSRWYVQGLVSYGIPEEGSKKCSSDHYAVFTRVGRFGDWIVRTLSRENLI